MVNNYFNVLKSLECWSLIAGKGTGSVISLGFGEKIKRNCASKNKSLSELDRNYEPECSILIYCSWRLITNDKIICSWKDAIDSESMIESISILKGCKIENIDIKEVTYDIDLKFDNGMLLQVFCDQTNDYEASENYSLFYQGKIVTVGLNSTIEVEDDIPD